MIENFWNWMYQTVGSALNTLNLMYSNSTMKPFFDLLIVIIGVAVIIRFIIKPMLGSSGSSDKAKRKDEEE